MLRPLSHATTLFGAATATSASNLNASSRGQRGKKYDEEEDRQQQRDEQERYRLGGIDVVDDDRLLKPSSYYYYHDAVDAHDANRTDITTARTKPYAPNRYDNGTSNQQQHDDDGLSTTSTFLTIATHMSHNHHRHGHAGNTSRYEEEDRPAKGTWSDFFFGFMYEEQDDKDLDDDDASLEHLMYSSAVESYTSLWTHRINWTLFVSLLLVSLANVVPVALMATMSADFYKDSDEASNFAPRAASAAVLGTSFGKFLNGPIGDVWGGRRTSSLYSLLLALALLALAMAPNEHYATYACFAVEFATTVQWPCCLVILATHYRGHSHGQYEGGIYVTSLALRLGALLGIPLCSLLLKHYHWRMVALLGAWVALLAVSVTFLYVEDAPGKPDEPQNPIDPNLLHKWFPNLMSTLTRPQPANNNSRGRFGVGLTSSSSSSSSYVVRPGVWLRLAMFVIHTNVIPSLKHILSSGTFWIVALAHTGSAMVRTSERVLGTYLLETSNGYLSESRASGLAVFLSLGTVGGLVLAGSRFACRKERERKYLVTRLYMMTIASCYMLAFWAIPQVRRWITAPDLILVFQLMAIATAGFGIAVPFYHIPSLVGATFGCDKGLYSSYTDGVAYGIASLVWKIVASAVQHTSSSNDEDGGGWAYGWAAVALLLIPSAILMVEFMEHYFCRHRYGGTLETILIA